MHHLLVGALVAGLLTAAAPTTADTTITIDPRAGLETVAPTAVGVNDAVWDAQLGTTAVSDLLGNAGVKMIRYPGGSYGDIYHWQDNTAPGGYVAPGTDFDTFMASAQRIGAQPMIIANYGTGSAAEAAAWVKYANVTKGYGAKYWTIGNENYGNGHYGTAWEADNHTDKSPSEYAQEVVQYSEAMKAVDPTIKVGAVLTMPANWPDAIVGSGDQATWNQTVLALAGSHIDFVDVHWYPGGSSEADALGKTAQLNDAVYLLKQQIDAYAGKQLGISLTETNVGVGQDTQPGALFLADTYTSLFENGIFTVDWWNVHNGLGNVSTVGGQTDYNDFGMLSSGNCSADGTTCEPPMNTPFAPYYALQLVSRFVSPGDQLIRASADDPLVRVHAAVRPNGDLAVLLLNEDPSASRVADLNFQGWTASGTGATVTTYGNGGSSLQTAAATSATTQTLPPYSLTLLTLHPANSVTGLPQAPGRPTASNVTDRAATISWPAATAGSHAIAKYEVYRQDGALLGETAGTSLVVSNLDPGTRYGVTVVARDTAGGRSPSSPPVTLATGTPSTSTCSVKLTDTNDWANGYVGNIDVTSSVALSGWTLAFDWPTGWQSIGSGWNGTWAQSGRTVRVTGSPAIAAGGTVSVGYVASYNGPNVPPGVFTLNGTVCSS